MIITTKTKVYLAVIIVLVLIIVLQKSCGHNTLPDAVITKTDTIWRQSPVDVIVDSIPYPVYVTSYGKPIIVTKIDTILLKNDPIIGNNPTNTAFIDSDYFKHRVYSDTLRKDSSTVTLKEDVYQNKLVEREAIFSLRYPEIHSTVTIAPKNKVFAGIDLGGSNLPWVNAGVSFALLTKADNLYALRGGYTTEGKFYAGGTIYFKIHL